MYFWRIMRWLYTVVMLIGLMLWGITLWVAAGTGWDRQLVWGIILGGLFIAAGALFLRLTHQWQIEEEGEDD